MDKLLKEAEAKNGKPAHFVFEPKEAADFIREIIITPSVFKNCVEFQQVGDDVVDIRFLLKTELTHDMMYTIVSKWFKGTLVVFYKEVEIQIVQKKVLEVPKPNGPIHQDDIDSDEHVLTPNEKTIPILPPPPPPPTPPPSRIISNGFGNCEKCGSRIHRKWLFWADGCIQPKCEDYYKK